MHCTMARSSWGSKRQKAKGVWELRYTVDGKPKSKRVRGSARDADRELAALRLRYEGAARDDSVPLGAFFRSVFVPECETRVASGDMAASTLNGYLRVWDASLKESWDDTPMRDIRPQGVQAWLNPMTAGKARHAKALMSAVLSRAETLEYIEVSPMRKRYVMPTAASPRRRSDAVFSAEELEEVLAECRGEFFEPFAIMAACGGVQRAEAVGVDPADVAEFPHESGAYAVVPMLRGVHNLSGEIVVEDHVKNSFRAEPAVVPPPHSLRLLEIARERAGERWLVDDGFGGPVDPDAVSREWKRWLSTTRHPFVPFGNLRNTYSTALHARGMEDSAVAKLMRHAELGTDYRHYNRIGVAEKVGLLAGVLGQSAQNGPEGRGEDGL